MQVWNTRPNTRHQTIHCQQRATMKSLTVVVLLSTLAVCCMVSNVDGGIECYECGSADTECPKEEGSFGTSVTDCASCGAAVLNNGKIVRECEEQAIETDRCSEDGQVCLCTTDLCNTEAKVIFSKLPRIRCYTCGLDTGGAKCSNEEGRFGTETAGCQTCSKSFYPDGTIVRSCLLFKEEKEICNEKAGFGGCACFTDLCNAAVEVALSRLLIGWVLAAILVLPRLF